MDMNANVIKTLNYIKRNGLIKGYYAIRERIEDKKSDTYSYEPISEEERLEEVAWSLDKDITFSILVPTYETPPQFLREMIDSVIEQTYRNWQLVIADASMDDRVKSVVEEYFDDRIDYIRLAQNGGISENSNAGLLACRGDYVCLLDHDDVLTKDALYCNARAIFEASNKGIVPEMIYSNEDKMDGDGTRFFCGTSKDKFNYDLIMTNNYICHFLVVKKELISSLGFRKEYDGAQDHDLVLRAVSKLHKEKGSEYSIYILNIERVLYHWRCHEASTAANPKSKMYAYESGKRAVESFLVEEGIKASVKELPHMGFFYVDYEPDILIQRREVAAVGYRVVNRKGYVSSGVFDENMNTMFGGLHKGYSGGLFHVAACQRQVAYVDVRYMKANEIALEEYNRLLSEYTQGENSDKNIDYKELSRRFCDIMKDKGFSFVYDPAVIKKEIG